MHDECQPVLHGPEAVASVLQSLKEIVSIVMGLALTNCVLVLITRGEYTHVEDLSVLPVSSALYSLVLIVNIVRFYHGNLRHMETLYGRTAQKVRASVHGHGRAPFGGLGIDFVVVFMQSIIFAVMSFYATGHNGPRREFLLLFMVLMAFDLVWNIMTQQAMNDAKELRHQRRWILNNLVAVVAILVLYLKFKQHQEVVYLDIGAGVLATNTIVDFVISWGFYFPSLMDPVDKVGVASQESP